MTMDAPGEDEYLTRREASAYLKSIGDPLAVQTLANMAANNNAGGGPPFISIGWRTLRYPKKALNAWAAARKRR